MRYDDFPGDRTTNERPMATIMATVMARVAAARQARRAAGGPNEPSDPATFPASHIIKMSIDLDNEIDDQRRIVAEQWCLGHAKHRWCRRTDKRLGEVSFEFEDDNDAIKFRLWN